MMDWVASTYLYLNVEDYDRFPILLIIKSEIIMELISSNYNQNSSKIKLRKKKKKKEREKRRKPGKSSVEICSIQS